MPLEQVASRFQAIDIDLLISLFVPVDFSLRSKIIDMHVLATIAICKEFSQVVVKHCVQLSSIYVHEPGYVPENEEASRTIGIFKFGDRKGVAAYLDETFETDKEAWRWSIRFIEENYMSLAQRVDVVRLPALGPTLSSNEGYATKFNYFTYLLYQMGTGLVRNVEGLR